MEELAIRVRLEGVEQANAQARRFVDNLTAITASITAFTSTLATFASLSFADEVEALQIQFEALTGSAEEAAQIMSEIRRIAGATQFDTSAVARFAAMLRSAGVQGQQLTNEIEALLNLSAALGVRRADFELFAMNLMQLRSGAATAADVKQMLRVAPGIATMLARSLGRERMTVADISALLQTEGGERFFQRLVGLGAQFQGQAERVTIFAAIANFVELIQNAMLPSAQLLSNILRVLINRITPVVKAFESLNRAMGGVPGLILNFAAAVIAATTAMRALSSTGIVRTVVEGMQIFLAVIVMILTRLRMLVFNLGRFSVVGLLSLLLDAIGRQVGGAVGDALSSIGIGTGIGAAIGSIVPAIGTALGALIGALIGLIIYAFSRIFGTPQRAETAEERTARNTERMTRTLEDIRVQLVGGGTGASSVRTRFEAELAIRKALQGEVV